MLAIVNKTLLIISICLVLRTSVSGMMVTPEIDAMYTPPKKCTMERYEKLLGYVCSKLNLREVPQTLKSDFEILDVSVNRIRELSPKSFENYISIKYLYLFDNVLQTIEANTFAQLRGLEAIDLSTNALATIPKDLFDLPLLRNLYIAENALVTLSNDLKIQSKPIVAPLRILGLASCKLNAIPDFGPLPDLYMLNVSRNELTLLQPQDFSAFCTFKEVDLSDTKIPMCKCHQVKQYIVGRKVQIDGVLNCDAHPPERSEPTFYCPEPQNATVDSPIYDTCLNLVQTRRLNEESQMTWMTIGGCMLGFLFVFVCILYFLHRRNVRHVRRTKSVTIVAQKKAKLNENLLVREEQV